MSEIAERFAKDTERHVMKVRRDDGLYRHLEFRRFAPYKEGEPPSLSSSYWFDLVTWPGCLTVNGGCGSFTFSRVEDMFTFFRGNRINPSYWDEKVRGETRTKCYSEEKFRQYVDDAAAEAEEQWPGLTEAAVRDIFGQFSEWNSESEEGARHALFDFEFGRTHTASCSCGASAEGLEWGLADRWRTSHRLTAEPGGNHKVTITEVDGFTFDDREWDLRDWDWQFLWCLHAIVWGISRYDAAVRQPVPAGDAA